MAEVIYICKTAQHNKFWSYEIQSDPSYTVLVRWGRLGLDGQSQTQSFSSRAAMQAFIDSKIKEKVKKGYAQSTKEEHKKEEETAKKLGWQYKISRLLFVEKRAGDLELKQLSSYDPNKHIYVEILNSWTKEVTHLVLNKTEAFTIKDVIEVDKTIQYGSTNDWTVSQFVSAVRDILRSLAAKVVAATVKFAAMGARKLDLGDDEEDSPVVQELAEMVADTTMSKQVISKFASLGGRVLEL